MKKVQTTVQQFTLPLNKPESTIWGLNLVWSPVEKRLIEISTLAHEPRGETVSPLTQSGVLQETAQALLEFFDQDFSHTHTWLKKFLPQMQGSPFQLAVWRQIAKIPEGKVASYKEIASMAGSPNAVRAVGTACGSNPYPFLVPCHRVVASSGIGGYGLGLPLKKWLLRQEKINNLKGL